MKTKTRKTRSSKRRSKSSGKDVLVGLIAKEMVRSGQDEANVLPEEADAPTMSAEDIFYAQMNGEAIDSRHSKQSIFSDDDELDDDIDDDDDDGFSDAHSFAGLALPEDGYAGLEVEGASEKSSSMRSTRSSVETVSKASRSSRSSQSSGDDTLSMDEIQCYVRENMPEEVRNKIPQEAWGRIFGDSLLGDETSKPPNKVEVLEDEEKEEDDDSSVISDLTEYTEFIKSASTKPEDAAKVVPMAPDEAKWDVDICPSLQPDFSPAENRSFRSTRSRESASMTSPSDRGGVSLRTDLSGSILKSEHTKGVRFNIVQVRYYERILDINPAVTSGAAIGIGWRYKRGGHVSVNEWELQRGDLRRSKDLIMPRHLRQGLLKEIGYTQKDIAEATRIIRKAKDRRKTTIANLSSQGMEEAVEMATRKVKGLLSFGAFGKKNGPVIR
jgi:hypothetical protein